VLDPAQIVDAHPHGQLLVAGWASIEPARSVRRIAFERKLYLETFLAAVYPLGAARVIVLVPLAQARLPGVDHMPGSLEELKSLLPPHCIMVREDELPRGAMRGNAQSYAQTMAMWERLAAPFVAGADAQVDPAQRMDGYRQAIRVDYACELAHQKLAEAARQIARGASGN
jgi:hypothetical protein